MSFLSGISPNVGCVGCEVCGVVDVDVVFVVVCGDVSFSDAGAGGSKYECRSCACIILRAHVCRSTGVRLAACRKASLSCYN